MAEPFYIVEVCRGKPFASTPVTRWGPNAGKPPLWDIVQEYPHLWLAKSFVDTALRNRPDLRGRYRICRCQPLPLRFEGDTDDED